jgi:hypothetical protein
MKKICFVWALGFAMLSNTLSSAPITYNFTGATDIDITEGANTIPFGTPFAGTFAYDSGQPGTITTFRGGTQSAFTFNWLTLTIAGQTVTEGPGSLGLYNDVTSSPNGVPNGDSLYTFVPGIPNNSPNPSTGTINGITPNFIYLGFVDPVATAFSGPGLPTTLHLPSFSGAFLGLDYGPLGAGNTVTIHPLSTLTGSTLPSQVPETSSLLVFLMSISACMVAQRKWQN